MAATRGSHVVNTYALVFWDYDAAPDAGDYDEGGSRYYIARRETFPGTEYNAIAAAVAHVDETPFYCGALVLLNGEIVHGIGYTDAESLKLQT